MNALHESQNKMHVQLTRKRRTRISLQSGPIPEAINVILTTLYVLSFHIITENICFCASMIGAMKSLSLVKMVLL